MKVEGFIFLCISRYVQSGASLLSMYQEFSSKKFFNRRHRRGPARDGTSNLPRTSSHDCKGHVVSRVPVVSKFDDGTVVRHYRNWALEKHEFSNVAPEMMCEGGWQLLMQSRADPAFVRSFVRSFHHSRRLFTAPHGPFPALRRRDGHVLRGHLPVPASLPSNVHHTPVHKTRRHSNRPYEN